MLMKSSVNYEQILEIGVNFLELAPSEVWRLTPDEFYVLVNGKLKRLGLDKKEPMSLERFEALKQQFPDDMQVTPR